MAIKTYVTKEKAQEFILNSESYFKEELECTTLPDGFIEKQEDLYGSIGIVNKVFPDRQEQFKESIQLGISRALEEFINNFLTTVDSTVYAKDEDIPTYGSEAVFTEDGEEVVIQLRLTGVVNVDVSIVAVDVKNEEDAQILLEKVIEEVREEISKAN